MRQSTFMGSMTVILTIGFVSMIILLVYTSMQVSVLSKKLQQTQQHIYENRSVSNTLDAEWAYLISPERIERLSRVLLPLEQSVSAKNMRFIDAISPVESLETISVGDSSYSISAAR